MNQYVVTRDDNHDEMEHYGVIGMKWGRRRANVNSAKAMLARRRGNIKAAERYKAKSEKIRAKHIRRAGGQKSYDYSRKEKLGKTIVKACIFGTYGTLRYNELRAKGAKRGKAAVVGALASGGNRLTGGLLGIVEPRLRN